MLGYALRRTLSLLPMAAGMVVATFCLLLIVPGDPAAVLLGQDASAAAIAETRRNLGLDHPWYQRLGSYFAALLQGDLGNSPFQNRPVAALISERIGATFELAVAALIVAVALGVTLGVIAAANRGTAIDVTCMVLAQIGVSMPVFWLGILLMLWFAVQLQWLPAIGRETPIFAALAEAFHGRPEILGTALSHLVLPAVTLGVNSAAIISRLVRASMLEVLAEDFIRTATAKGLRRWQVLVRHALRNALLPIVSIIGLRFGMLLGGAVLTESIFGWPGLGQLTVTAISQRDLQLVQGLLLTFALMFAIVNLFVDLICAALDPRVRLR